MNDQAQQEFQSAQRMMNHRKWEEAAVHLRQAIELEPGTAECHGVLAIALARQERYGDALEQADQALFLDAKCGSAIEARSRVLHWQDKQDAALEEVERGLQVQPKDLRLCMWATILCDELGEPIRAEEYSQRARAIDPESFEVAFAEGIVKAATGDHEAAIAAWGRASAKRSEHVVVFVLRAIERAAIGDFRGAIKNLDQALDINPADAWAFTERGIVRQYHLNDAKRAIQDYSRAIQVDPQYERAYAARGAAKRTLKDSQGALADFGQALEIDPGYGWALMQRGDLRQDDLDDFRGAIEDYTRVIQADPQHKRAYACRGLAKRWLKDHRGAVADFERALTIDPEYSWALERRAEYFAAMNDHESALADRAKLYQLEPKASLTLTEPDSQFWYDRAYRHFNELLLPQIQDQGEHFVEYWECYLFWGQKTTQSMYQGTSAYVHNATSGAGYVCATDKTIVLVSLRDVTRRFVKKRGLIGRMFFAALRSYDFSRREMNDKTSAVSHGDIVGISSDDDWIILNTVSEDWRVFPYFNSDKPSLLAALNMARRGRLVDIWRPKEPEPPMTTQNAASQDDIFGAIKQLKELRDIGAISEEEYQAKKDELLSRL